MAVDRKFKITKNDIIRTFNEVPKFASYFLALDRKFKITQNDIIKIFDQVPKKNLWILAVDRIINKSFDQLTNF